MGAYSMHPGWTDTAGARTAMGGLFKNMEGRLRSLQQGADTAVWLSLEVRALMHVAALLQPVRLLRPHCPPSSCIDATKLQLN